MNGRFRDIMVKRQDVWFGPLVHARGKKGRTFVVILRTAEQIRAGSGMNSKISGWRRQNFRNKEVLTAALRVTELQRYRSEHKKRECRYK